MHLPPKYEREMWWLTAQAVALFVVVGIAGLIAILAVTLGLLWWAGAMGADGLSSLVTLAGGVALGVLMARRP